MIGATEERIDQKLQHIGNVVARTFLSDLAHEPPLMFVDTSVGIGPVPGKHLDRVTANRTDLLHAPVGNGAGLAAARGLLDAVLLKRHDETAARGQQVDGGGHRKVRIEQHRAAMRREIFHQQPLGGSHVGIFDLVARDALCLRDGVEQWRPLVQRNHAKVAIRIRQARDAPVFSDRSHWCVLMKARQSLMEGIPARPPERVHFSAAAAAANAMASCTLRPAPIAKT